MSDALPSKAGVSAPTSQPSPSPRVWPMELAALFFMALNVLLAAPLGLRAGYRGEELWGYLLSPVIIPILAIGVMSLFKSKRNRLSRVTCSPETGPV